MSEYEFGISYIKGKENVGKYTLSSKQRIFSLIPLKVDLNEKVLGQLLGDGWYIKVTLDIQSGNKCDSKYHGYYIEEDGLLWYQGRMYIPKEGDLREAILREAHKAHYCAHPRVKKMYADMKKLFFWAGMKSDVVDFVSKCLESQQVKANHRHPAGLLQPHDIL